MAAWLRFTKLHLNNLKTCEIMSFGQTTKVEMFGDNAEHHVSRKLNTAFQHKHLIPAVQHCGEGLMIAACFAAT